MLEELTDRDATGPLERYSGRARKPGKKKCPKTPHS